MIQGDGKNGKQTIDNGNSRENAGKSEMVEREEIPFKNSSEPEYSPGYQNNQAAPDYYVNNGFLVSFESRLAQGKVC